MPVRLVLLCFAAGIAAALPIQWETLFVFAWMMGRAMVAMALS